MTRAAKMSQRMLCVVDDAHMYGKETGSEEKILHYTEWTRVPSLHDVFGAEVEICSAQN